MVVLNNFGLDIKQYYELFYYSFISHKYAYRILTMRAMSTINEYNKM